MDNELNKKIEFAIKIMKAIAPTDGSPVEVSYSGGKDSDVILALTKMAGIPYRAIYKNTTIDPPGTIAHCKANGVEIIDPKFSFLEIVERHGMPTRRSRHCCSILKEYKILNVAIQGIRRSESSKRAARYKPDDQIICRFYGSKKNHVSLVLPILNWSDNQVAEFIEHYNIQCHPLYYNEDGTFNPAKRLGCIGCPLKSDQGKADYIKYPKLFKAMTSAVCKWWITHPNTKSRTKFSDPYGLIAHNILFRSYNEYAIATHTLFGESDWKTYLENMFNVELPSIQTFENMSK